MERRTWSPKLADLNVGKRWYLVDAEGQTLGRIASVIAATLRQDQTDLHASRRRG